MTDTFAPTARPSQAAIAWATKDGLFVEYAVKGGGPPFVVRFKRTVDGLAAALNILIEQSEPVSPRAEAPHPAVKKQLPGTAEQRAAAAEIVRRMFK